ncbi:MAG: ATP-binding protein [Spirochaetales bacterium]|nr:ATP-binding protein [Spirochaetales bacterium]
MLGYSESDIGGVLENLVYLELRRRGYRVATGKAEAGKIDFVAEDRSGKLYIQVAHLAESRQTVEHALKAFSRFDGVYPRYLLSLEA